LQAATSRCLRTRIVFTDRGVLQMLHFLAI
jgi:hypothetical protein